MWWCSIFLLHGMIRCRHLIRGTDGQMQQSRGAAAEDGLALEDTAEAARAHPDSAVCAKSG